MRYIFINGIQQRSGTNFLNALLLLHPDCRQPKVKIRENWFLEDIGLVDEYVKRLHARWANEKWGGSPFYPALTGESLGAALMSLLCQGEEDAPKVLVSKTPSVKNLNRFIEYFPSAKLLLLVRDPRDVAMSAQRTWNKPIKDSLRDWAVAADEIMRFQQNGGECHLIQYEELVRQPETTMQELLRYCDLSVDRFPYDKIKNLPIYGSSDTGRTDSHLKKHSGFKSIGRWKHWPEEQKQLVSNALRTFLVHFRYELD